MTKTEKFLSDNWHKLLAFAIITGQALIFIIVGKNLYTGICDNLDLFIAQLKVLKDNHAFFGGNRILPILGGLERNYFPSELSAYNLLYFFLPVEYAYIAGLILKPIIALVSSVILAKVYFKEDYAQHEKSVYLCALAFGMLPLYPAYSFCFVSLPLLLALVIKAYRQPKNGLIYLGLFAYPFLSYFSFFGIFILGYVAVAILLLTIKDKKLPFSMIGALFSLLMGYLVFEHRLFYLMLFSKVPTIRSEMVVACFDGPQIWETFKAGLLNGVAHAETIHKRLVLPCICLYMLWLLFICLKKKKPLYFLLNPFMLTIYFIIFNALVYALYYWEPLRNLFEALLPPLKGFSYGRTIFFNAFAWYLAFFFVLKDLFLLCEKMGNRIRVTFLGHLNILKLVPIVLGLLAIAFVLKTQTQYNDLYNSSYCYYYRQMKGGTPNSLSFNEFYGGDIFNKIKADIDYSSKDYAVAYGFHPATLQYNQISTVDGYCGYYSLDYKKAFRQAIAPTLENQEGWKYYYDNFGYRAYLFSNDGRNTYDFGARDAIGEADELNIDFEALKGLGCRYIFSRFELTNDYPFSRFNQYSDSSVPYNVYLYEL